MRYALGHLSRQTFSPRNLTNSYQKWWFGRKMYRSPASNTVSFWGPSIRYSSGGFQNGNPWYGLKTHLQNASFRIHMKTWARIPRLVSQETTSNSFHGIRQGYDIWPSPKGRKIISTKKRVKSWVPHLDSSSAIGSFFKKTSTVKPTGGNGLPALSFHMGMVIFSTSSKTKD